MRNCCPVGSACCDAATNSLGHHKFSMSCYETNLFCPTDLLHPLNHQILGCRRYLFVARALSTFCPLGALRKRNNCRRKARIARTDESCNCSTESSTQRYPAEQLQNRLDVCSQPEPPRLRKRPLEPLLRRHG